MLQAMKDDPQDALAGATPYLRIFGLAAGGAYLAECALAARERGGCEKPENAARVATARFFAENIAPASSGLERQVVAGAHSVLGSDVALT